MKQNYFARATCLAVASALPIVVSTSATVRAQPLEQCTDDTNCASHQTTGELIGEPAVLPQLEMPVQLEPALANVQTLPEETTFELSVRVAPSVRTVLRGLNDLGDNISD
ncbi:MAG: hypothetical protein AAF716_18235 [Cyanobacteria bacterium P01_D01_bin.1]